MKLGFRRLLLVCVLACCLFIPHLSFAANDIIMPEVADIDDLEVLPVDPLHTHSFTLGPYYESTHKAGGHRIFYYCSAGDGATQVTGGYGTLPGCEICFPHVHSFTVGPYYESTHRPDGHRVYYYCSAGDGATQVTGGYASLPGCEICFPPAHICLPSAAYTESTYPHRYYYYICSQNDCPNGNNDDIGYTGGNAPCSFGNTGTLSSTHTALGHALTKNCSYTGCSQTQTTYVAYNEDCTTCNPPHVCIASTTYTEVEHPHRHY